MAGHASSIYIKTLSRHYELETVSGNEKQYLSDDPLVFTLEQICLTESFSTNTLIGIQILQVESRMYILEKIDETILNFLNLVHLSE